MVMHQKKVFITGCGRSGTHWLARTFNNHPKFFTTIEKKPIILFARMLASDKSRCDELLPKIYKEYEQELKTHPNKHYLDKSQQIIWFIHYIVKRYPDALFLGIQREPYAAISSMLVHGGIPRTLNTWNKFPVPNRYFGISKSISKDYDQLSTVERCALYWLTHKLRLRIVKNTFMDKVKIIQYEKFATDTKKTLSEITTFIGLDKQLCSEDVTIESLTKWKSSMCVSDVNKIKGIVDDSYFTNNLLEIVK